MRATFYVSKAPDNRWKVNAHAKGYNEALPILLCDSKSDADSIAIKLESVIAEYHFSKLFPSSNV